MKWIQDWCFFLHLTYHREYGAPARWQLQIQRHRLLGWKIQDGAVLRLAGQLLQIPASSGKTCPQRRLYSDTRFVVLSYFDCTGHKASLWTYCHHLGWRYVRLSFQVNPLCASHKFVTCQLPSSWLWMLSLASHILMFNPSSYCCWSRVFVWGCLMLLLCGLSIGSHNRWHENTRNL